MHKHKKTTTPLLLSIHFFHMHIHIAALLSMSDMSCQLMCGVRFIPAPHILERYSERYKSLHSSVSSADFVLMLMREQVFSALQRKMQGIGIKP